MKRSAAPAMLPSLDEVNAALDRVERDARTVIAAGQELALLARLARLVEGNALGGEPPKRDTSALPAADIREALRLAAAGASVSQIARRLGRHRRTIDRALEGGERLAQARSGAFDTLNPKLLAHPCLRTPDSLTPQGRDCASASSSVPRAVGCDAALGGRDSDPAPKGGSEPPVAVQTDAHRGKAEASDAQL